MRGCRQISRRRRTKKPIGADLPSKQMKPNLTQLQEAAQKAKDTKPVFADAEAMRAKVRQALIKPQYNVFDYYHRSGCLQAIAKSPIFENTTLLIILVNAIWISVDID